MSATRLLPLLVAASALAGCRATQDLADPTLLVHTEAGTELGVSTDFGVVFLGRHARGGDASLTAWFGDGPSLETVAIEPLGAGLYTAEPEIVLPWVPLAFGEPRDGAPVTVRGRRGASPWTAHVEVRRHPAVDGLLLSPGDGLRGTPEDVGAGVFLGGGPSDWRLLGLVSGRLTLEEADGRRRTYVTVVGPTELWRLVVHRRDLTRKRRWVYREDVM